MPIINFTNLSTISLALILFVLVLFLGKETHKSELLIAMLIVFLTILIGHATEFYLLDAENINAYQAITNSLVADFVFIFLSFISYLWIDDIQSKIEKRKSIDNSLSWFWAKV